MNASLPLSGALVVDFTRLVPGPFAGLILADLGATVVKIEDLQMGDYARFLPPMLDSDKGVLFELLNRNKKSAALDLKTEGGRNAALALCSKADIVLESFRPGVADKLGIGWAAVREVNPKAIYCSITGYGQETARAKEAGHDLNYLALAGFLANNRNSQGLALPGTQLADLVSGAMQAVIAILAAQVGVLRGGSGCFLDISMAHGFIPLLPMLHATAGADSTGEINFSGYLFGDNPQYGVYTTADGRQVALAAIEPKFWMNFCSAASDSDLMAADITTREGKEKLRAALTALFGGLTMDACMRKFGAADCCLTPVLSAEEALTAMHEDAYQLFAERTIEGRTLRYIHAVPAMFRAGFVPPPFTPAPHHGQHTRDLLSTLAGLDQRTIDSLAAAGAIASGSF